MYENKTEKSKSRLDIKNVEKYQNGDGHTSFATNKILVWKKTRLAKKNSTCVAKQLNKNVNHMKTDITPCLNYMTEITLRLLHKHIVKNPKTLYIEYAIAKILHRSLL